MITHIIFDINELPADREEKKQLLALCRELDLHIFSIDETVKEKADPALGVCQYLLNHYPLESDHSIYVCTNEEDAGSARRVGIHAVVFSDLARTEERIRLLVRLHAMDGRMCYCSE